MSKYNKFEDFMQSVINEADRKCRYRHSKSLTEAFNVAASTSTVIKSILDKGWWVLIALAAILCLGPLGFGAAVAVFCTTPAGIAVIGILAVCGVKGMKELYKNRVLPLAVKAVGESYKSDFNSHINQETYINNLVDRASDDLLNRITGR